MENRQKSTPLFTGLVEHVKRKPTQFHIPGHKAGRGLDEEFLEFIGQNTASIDLINIAPLDDLHNPKGIIKEAQALAAEAFGADYTFFSVQGTSTAIMAMILSVCNPGDKILVPRNTHRSILSGIIFSGAEPIFLHPVMDRFVGVAHGITTQQVEQALQQHPDAKAVLVINPTYYGMAADLGQIVKIAHSYDVPVLVDEAHGVHIHFNDDMPLSAMQAGADLAATSVHKIGGSLTQSSVLNLKGTRVKPKRVQTAMNMLMTTSTSYILLASLDVARRRLALRGRELAARALYLADWTRTEINKLPGLYCVGDEILNNKGVHDYDPTKLVVHIRELGLSGYEVERWLREKYAIEVELSDIYNILAVVTSGDNEQTVGLLVQALQELSREFYPKRVESSPIQVRVPEIPKLALSPRDAFYADTELVPMRESVGRIIAEWIMVYPPGIPIVLPGEVMSQQNLEYTLENQATGLPVLGPEDSTLKTIKVIKEK